MEPWHIVDPGGQLDVMLTPRFDKHTERRRAASGSETHQVFGPWSGRLRTDDGLELEFDGLQGFAEEAAPTLVADVSTGSGPRSTKMSVSEDRSRSVVQQTAQQEFSP